MSGFLSATGQALGNANQPQQISVDNVAPELRPLRQMLAQLLQQRLQGGGQQQPNIAPGLISPIEQLFGIRPTTGGPQGSPFNFTPGTGGSQPPTGTQPPGGGSTQPPPTPGNQPPPTFNPPPLTGTGPGGNGGSTGGTGGSNPTVGPSGGSPPGELFDPIQQFLRASADTFGGGQQAQASTLPGGIDQGTIEAIRSIGGDSAVDEFLRNNGVDPSTLGSTGGSTPGGSFSGTGFLDSPQFGGPFSAPLLDSQLGALRNAEQLFGNPSQIISNQDIQSQLGQALGGNPTFNPNGPISFDQAVQPFQTSSASDSFFADLFGAPVGGQQQPQAQNPFFNQPGLTASSGPQGGGQAPGLPLQGTQPPGSVPNISPQFDPSLLFGSNAPVGAGQATPSFGGLPQGSQPAPQGAIPPITTPPQAGDFPFPSAGPGSLAQQQGLGGANDRPNAGLTPEMQAQMDAINAGPPGPAFGVEVQNAIDLILNNAKQTGNSPSTFGWSPEFLSVFQDPAAKAHAESLGIQFRAEGGFLDPNAPTIVGENGPELIPPGNQQVIPLGNSPSLASTAGPQGGFPQSVPIPSFPNLASSTGQGGNPTPFPAPTPAPQLTGTADQGQGGFSIALPQVQHTTDLLGGFPGSETRGPFGSNSGSFGPFQPPQQGAIPNPQRQSQSFTPQFQNQATSGFNQGTGGGAQTQFTDAVLPNLTSSFNTALGAPRFDLTQTFQEGENLFNRDLERSLAGVREEFSGLGLGPGSTDRENRLLGTAGEASGRFRLGQQDLARQSFENAENRRLGAIGAAPGFASVSELPFQRQLQSLPALLAREQQATNNFFNVANPAAQRQQQTLGLLPSFSNLPFNQASQLFGLGNQARGIADQDIMRRMQSFFQSQGGNFNQALSLLGGTPPNQTEFGPSTLSQISGLLGGLFGAFG